MKLRYFSWLKSKTGVAQEEVTPPAEVTTVSGLLAWLKTRGPGYAEALEDLAVVHVAVNQAHAKPSDPVAPSDEVALFPPVTGG